jgi:hypothetical protein
MHQGPHDMKAKGNADPNHRPLSSAFLGPVDDTSLFRHPPQSFSGGGVSRFAINNPRLPKGRHLGYSSSVVRVCEAVYGMITITLRFYCVPLQGPRLAYYRGGSPTLCAAFFRFR